MAPVDRRTHEGRIPSRGRCHLYVFPCAWEDLCKLGFSRDPLARLQALHPRFFDFFDLDRGLLVETDTVAEARALETRLRRALAQHNAPVPLTVREEAGGAREWYRGAADALAREGQRLGAQGHPVHAPLRPWLRGALLQRVDRLHAWSAAMLGIDELEGLAGWTPSQQRVLDMLDALRAMDIDPLPMLPPAVAAWFSRLRAG
jgi:hypothetical protein